jgi:hypothetical protein
MGEFLYSIVNYEEYCQAQVSRSFAFLQLLLEGV